MNKPYCVVGCTRGTGLRIVQQLTARGAPVRCIARDPVKAQTLLPTEVDTRAGDVTNPDSLRWAEFGECGAIFFAVDITGGIAGRGLGSSLRTIAAALALIYLPRKANLEFARSRVRRAAGAQTRTQGPSKPGISPKA